MQQKVLFDESAETYDLLFTNSAIGMEQRKVVWKFLEKRVFTGMEVLEINCGTGEDALHLASLGCKVIATDASSGMIGQCLKKVQDSGSRQAPVFHRAAFDELDTLVKNQQFDLVFSNFSGLNVLDPGELRTIVIQLHSLLKPGGTIIFVAFAKNCIWEKAYMLLKGRFSEINRRSRGNPVMVNLSGNEVRVFYYSRAEMIRTFGVYFRFAGIRPVGLFIPPSYLEAFFRRNSFLLHMLSSMEKLFGRLSFLSGFADHYIAEFRKL